MKNRYHHLLFLLAVALTLSFASCVDRLNGLSGNTSADMTPEEAREAFELCADDLEIRPFTTSKTSRTKQDLPTITPLWKKAVSFTMGDGSFVS